jgi:O-antigen ligase
MNNDPKSSLTVALFGFYGLFVVGSTFSIALAQMALGVALLLFIFEAFKRKYNPFSGGLRRFYVAVAVYVGWLLFSSLFSPTPVRSIVSVREDWLFLAVPIGIYLMQNERYRRLLIRGFAVGVGVISIYAIVQFFTGLDPFHDYPVYSAGDFGYRARGNFGGRLTFANYYGTAGVLLLAWGLGGSGILNPKWRRIFIITGILALVGTVLSFSRGPVIAMMITLILMGVWRGRRTAAVTVVGLLAAIVLAWLTLPGLVDRFDQVRQRELNTEYEGSRLFIWNNSLKVIRDHPVFGVGISNFRQEYTTHLRPDIGDERKHAHAHNDVLSIAANNGIPGTVLYIIMWIVVLRLMWRGARRSPDDLQKYYSQAALAASIMFLLCSITEAAFADEEVRQMMMFVWAVGLWPWRHASENAEALEYS